ncbi:MAG: RnfABCDGE type electron transport complex subunit D [Tenericutes bacterium]|jgi:electron transport complex protein RnfD|nr:RnfABCDGE type electron transport complex subunit D [Mycoplasmatota bacterium]
MARFAGGKAPFLRISDQKGKNTNTIMRDFLIALLPVVLFSWYKNGIQVFLDGNINFFEMLYPLFLIIMGGFLSVVMEGIFFYVTDKKNNNLKSISHKLTTSYAVIPGIILALLLPIYTPIWVLMVATFIATIIGKMLFGGFGHNIFNPALLGYVIVGFTLSGFITDAGGVFNGSEVLIDSYASATPLGIFAQFSNTGEAFSFATLVEPYGNLWNFFIGTIPGGLGETSALAILIGGIWLVARKIIKWYTPVIYIGTVFILSWIIGINVGESGIWFPTYSILTGGVMFAAVFMITEPVTTPTNPLGKVVFALFLGTLTVLFRFVGNLPEGVATSLILMNIFAIPIDTYSGIIRTRGFKKPGLSFASVLFVIFIIIVAYTIIASVNMYTAFLPIINIWQVI